MLFALLGGRTQADLSSTNPYVHPTAHTIEPQQPSSDHSSGTSWLSANLAYPSDLTPACFLSSENMSNLNQVDPTIHPDELTMSAAELWARLQTFYEPTPVFWGQQGQLGKDGFAEMGNVGGLF